MVQEEEVAGTAYLAGQVVSHCDPAHPRALPCVQECLCMHDCALQKLREVLSSIPRCPHAAISPSVKAPVTDTASGLLAASERLKMPMLQGPPIEDDEEDYDEEEQPLSEDIEDEEDVDDEAGPSSAAGARAGESLCSDPCVSHSRGPLAGRGQAWHGCV